MSQRRGPVFTSVRHRRRRGRTAVRVALGGAGVVVVLGLLLGVGLWRYAATRLDGTGVAALADRDQPSPAATGAAPAGTASALVVATRDGAAESLLLVQTGAGRDRPVVVVLPRDLKVQPAGRSAMRLAATHAGGGAELVVRTVERYVGMDLDGYVEIDLVGLERLAAALGGVRVCLPEPVDGGGQRLPAGCQQLRPGQVGAYVQAAAPGGDLDRVTHRHRVVRAAMTEATALTSLLNPVRTKRVLDAVAASVRLHRGLGARAMLRAAGVLGGIAPDELTVRTVPGFLDPGTGFTHAAPDDAEALFQALRQGSAIPRVGITDPHANRLEAGDVTAAVLNAAGTQGLAAAVADRLRAAGVTVATVGNAEDFGRSVTAVRHAPDQGPRARVVARLLRDAGLDPEVGALGGREAGDAQVVVLLGTDARSLTRPATPAPGPT